MIDDCYMSDLEMDGNLVSRLPEQQALADVRIDPTEVIFDEALKKLKAGGNNSMDSVMGKIDLEREKIWTPDKASEYDYCMVLPPDCKDKGTFKQYTEFLQRAGLEVYAYQGAEDNVVLLIRAPENLLRIYADEINFKMKADPQVLEKIMAAGDSDEGIAPVTIAHDPEEAKYPPYEMIYLRYSTHVADELYKKSKGGKSPFSSSIRKRLIGLLIEAKPKWGGENIKIQRYIRTKKIVAYFPLHEPEKIEVLARLWLDWSVMPWAQPFYNIKEYYGEKIGLYFLFQGHYTSWLLGPAIIGLVLTIASLCYPTLKQGFNAGFLPFYAGFICIWAIYMLEHWKRLEAKTALEWGTDGFETGQQDMPEFKGKLRPSLIDGRTMIHFPSSLRKRYILESVALVSLMVVGVIGCVASIYIIKDTLVGDWNMAPTDAQTIASIINAGQILVANYLYQLAAVELTKRENHRTITEYEDNLTMKVFCFQFINSYASFFYVAFFASNELFNKEACRKGLCCGRHGCMYSLGLNLIIIFGTRLVSGNITELLVPWITNKIFSGSDDDSLTRPEKEMKLSPFSSSEAVTAEFTEVAIQMGYQTLFACALPAASTFALVSNVAEIRGDAWKLLRSHQRPTPQMVEDIGAFQTIFTILAVCSVITNACLIRFTMSTLNSWGDNQWWVFVGFQWGLFFLMGVVTILVDNESSDIDIQKGRAAFYQSKVIDKSRDDRVERERQAATELEILDYPDFGGMANLTTVKRSAPTEVDNPIATEE